jgi:hypothetical protein
MKVFEQKISLFKKEVKQKIFNLSMKTNELDRMLKGVFSA